jgi:NitT/TauT family transport system substrate-binding protein
MLQAGRLDVAISGADELLIRRKKGLDAVAILPGFQDSPIGLMSHAERGLTRFEDVKGRVAIEGGSPFQQFLWAKYGWDGKVEMVPTTGSVGAFATDKEAIQQAYITSEPCVAEGLGVKVNFIPAREAGWNPYSSMAIVMSSAANDPWVKAFADASLAGWKGYLADPARADAEISKINPNMPAAQMDCIVGRQKEYISGKDGVGVMTQARWDEMALALKSVGQDADPTGAWKTFGPATADAAPASGDGAAATPAGATPPGAPSALGK